MTRPGSKLPGSSRKKSCWKQRKQATVWKPLSGMSPQTPSVAKLSVLKRAYDEQLAIFEQNPQEADKLLAIGKEERTLKLPALEHAALTQVCLGILNLDQSLTRE